MATPDKLMHVTPEKVQELLNRHGTQAAAARKLKVSQAALSIYMRNHGFRQVKRWERQ